MSAQEIKAIDQSAAPVAMDPAQLLKIAVERDADLDKLERLMALQERWEQGEARKAFDAAMSAFKADAPKITKNKHVSYPGKGGQTSYHHATLDHICQTVNPRLSENGLTYSWETQQADGIITVTCVVSHVRGHCTRTALSSTPDASGGKNSIQGVGSAVTYLQRYTLLSALGLATEEQDDDGAATGEAQAAAQGGLNERQLKEVRGLLAQAGMTDQELAAKAGVASVDMIDPSRLPAMTNYLRQQATKRGNQQ